MDLFLECYHQPLRHMVRKLAHTVVVRLQTADVFQNLGSSWLLTEEGLILAKQLLQLILISFFQVSQYDLCSSLACLCDPIRLILFFYSANQKGRPLGDFLSFLPGLEEVGLLLLVQVQHLVGSQAHLPPD